MIWATWVFKVHIKLNNQRSKLFCLKRFSMTLLFSSVRPKKKRRSRQFDPLLMLKNPENFSTSNILWPFSSLINVSFLCLQVIIKMSVSFLQEKSINFYRKCNLVVLKNFFFSILFISMSAQPEEGKNLMFWVLKYFNFHSFSR